MEWNNGTLRTAEQQYSAFLKYEITLLLAVNQVLAPKYTRTLARTHLLLLQITDKTGRKFNGYQKTSLLLYHSLYHRQTNVAMFT